VDVAAPEFYLEDFVPGHRLELGSYEMHRDECIAFARKWDPQPFHVDDERARELGFDGVIACGWHTASLTMRLWVDSVMSRCAALGSPGIDKLRFLRPVRPGDTITASAVVLDSTQSWHGADRGSVRTRTEVRNQDGELVMTMVSRGLIARRATGS